jgi:hypothetical protein
LRPASGFQDSVLDAVDDMEDLTTGIARKVWQKITLIDLMQKSTEAILPSPLPPE